MACGAALVVRFRLRLEKNTVVLSVSMAYTVVSPATNGIAQVSAGIA